MSDRPLPAFMRPARTNPLWKKKSLTNGQLQSLPVLSAADFPPLFSPANNPSNLKDILESSDASKSQRTERVEEDIQQDIGQAFNIYARPFVPESSTIINKLNGPMVETPATKRIHFGAYVASFAGSAVLQPFPSVIGLPINVAPDIISLTHYELFFRYHLEQEIKSQKQENELYSLYNAKVAVLHDQSQTICALTVPGLREYSPFVEEDDPIQIRQLYHDSYGRPLGMDHWLARGRVGGFPAPGWSGIIYNARVSAIQRKEERLLVRICGLITPTNNQNNQRSSSGQYEFRFNVQFPVPMDRYHPMAQALSIIQETFTLIKNPPLSGWSAPVLSLNARNSLAGQRPWLQRMLFPTEADCEEQTNLNPGTFKRPFFDHELNWEQKKAIESVCSQNYGSLPFLISGPPGTGKTKTLVEIAVQLIKSVNKVSHVLFCAPSDPAADTIAQRLSVHFTPAELLRLNRPARTFAEVPDTVLPFCCILEDKFDMPPFKKLMSYKLVVTTCKDASLLLYSRLRNSDLYTAEYSMRDSVHPFATRPSEVDLHWTALLMDESAQAIEPEATIPLAVVAPPVEYGKLAFTPLFVMAGDEHQLGPRTSSRTSPLRTSLLGRLFQRTVYANHPLARGNTGTALPALNRAMLPIPRPAFANLIRNYRSHPAILAVPSALFYADTLEPEAADTDHLAGWSGWQGRKWPVLFHGNYSDDDLEQDGGGWYNIGEARIACQYAARLVQTGLVAQKEVCIMSPFKAQVQCLRKTIRQKQYGSLWDVDIGPTEAFQGLERGVVILCTTRSRLRFVEKDKEIDWGIIGMPNKMNVALTRAKFGLIVIGKEDTLFSDPSWKEFLNFCKRNGLVTEEAGIAVKDAVELTRLEKVLLAKEGKLNGSRVIRGIEQHDEMWRHEQDPSDYDGYGFSDEEDLNHGSEKGEYEVEKEDEE